MCDKNIIELQNIDFGSVNDEFNWITSGSQAIETVSGQLKLSPDTQTTAFNRGLGTLDAANDRVNLKMNLDVYRPQLSQHDMVTVVFGVYLGNALIDQFSVFVDSIGSGTSVSHFLDRSYKYAELAGDVSLKITVPQGFQNELYLSDMIVTNERFCEDQVRTYFVLDGFLDAAIASVSSGLQLLEWKVGDLETLTQAFFDENNSPGADPGADWLLAFADIDGTDREIELVDPNTFNPFESEFGLAYENATGNFHGGKPTGTISGSDYGQGVLTLGLGKPHVLNRELLAKDGAFFIDVDYSKNLKVVFHALVNNANVNVFDSPAMFRKYTIEWNAATCAEKFYYQDQLAANTNTIVPVDKDGFLSGLTAGLSSSEIVGCDQSFSYSGNSGTFEVKIDFGSEIGQAGINYNALNIPDKFEIEWNGQIYSTGFVGSSDFNQQLINVGIPQSQIKTANPSNGSGQLSFQKTTASPSFAIIRVTAPLGNTGWNIAGICPDGVVKIPPTVTMDTIKSNYTFQEQITFNITAGDDVGIASWILEFADGTTQNGLGTPPATITHSFNTQGSKPNTITVTDDDGLTATATVTINVSSDSQYILTGTKTADCNNGINATLEVVSGFVEVYNKQQYFFSNQQIQDPPLTPMNITDGVGFDQTILGFEKTTVPPGTYTITSPSVDCSQVTSISSIVII